MRQNSSYHAIAKSPPQCWMLGMPEKDILGFGHAVFNAPWSGLYQSFTLKCHRQLRVKDLHKVPTWRLERDSKPATLRTKATNLPMSRHKLSCFSIHDSPQAPLLEGIFFISLWPCEHLGLGAIRKFTSSTYLRVSHFDIIYVLDLVILVVCFRNITVFRDKNLENYFVDASEWIGPQVRISFNL